MIEQVSRNKKESNAGMKLTDRPTRKNLILVAAVLLCIALTAGATFAAYTSQGHMRGVVRNRDNETVRFTSNYLRSCTKSAADKEDYAGKVILYSNESVNETEIVIDIYVYNYVLGNMSLINENDITYDMMIKLSGGTKTSYSVKLEDAALTQASSDDSGIIYTTPSDGVTLTGRTPHANHYTVTITGADLDKIRITAVATPRNLSVTGNQLLAAVIAPCTESTVQEFTCKGIFADSTTGTPKDYDAFNYEVSISAGRANVTITWKADKLEIDPFFLKKIAARESDNEYTYTKKNGEGNGSLTFVMDQSAGMGDYMIPFYLTSPQEELPDTWEAMDDYISVDGEQIDNVQDGQ